MQIEAKPVEGGFRVRWQHDGETHWIGPTFKVEGDAAALARDLTEAAPAERARLEALARAFER